jgi:hypothetical protein
MSMRQPRRITATEVGRSWSLGGQLDRGPLPGADAGEPPCSRSPDGYQGQVATARWLGPGPNPPGWGPSAGPVTASKAPTEVDAPQTVVLENLAALLAMRRIADHSRSSVSVPCAPFGPSVPVPTPRLAAVAGGHRSRLSPPRRPCGFAPGGPLPSISYFQAAGPSPETPNRERGRSPSPAPGAPEDHASLYGLVRYTASGWAAIRAPASQVSGLFRKDLSGPRGSNPALPTGRRAAHHRALDRLTPPG